MPRTITIAGNWKMNKTATEAAELAKPIIQAVANQSEITVVVCPPYTALQTVGGLIANSSVRLGAQNMSDKASGAYTGEISASMLRDLHVTHVILGHSERRAYYGETDEIVNKKTIAALENSLKPILCVGETLAEREASKTFDVIRTQLVGGFKGISAEQAENVIIAYEPVWAIGTGKTATPAMAQEVHAYIRKELTSLYGDTVAQKIRILYGGSMKPDNADALLSETDIDGGLIGGAALTAKDFLALVESGKAASLKKA
ncbi:MAG: triose-phosphate isomerase [Puniceicoccales bacterium]|jgi:triosephosphate isomerase|nr:triose-phosphate isomerase [Puniceicoccales bacterium]